MPRQPSLAFRSQDVRRKVWMLKAKKQGLRPERASKLSRIVLKLEKKIKYMDRQQHRGEFKDSLRRVSESARAAGFKWATDYYLKNDWAGQPTPSSQALNEILLHLVKVPGYDYSSWSRSRLCSEAQSLLYIYDIIPPKLGTEEFKKARVRMIADMNFQGALQQELAKGFCVSDEELAEAQQALFPTDDRRWSLLPLEMTPWFYKENNFQWLGVQSWIGVQEHELPLRISITTSARPLLLTTQGTGPAGKLKSKDHEMPANPINGKASGNEDGIMEDLAVGAAEDKHDHCEKSSDVKESSSDRDKFGDPFPAPDDYPWAFGC
ncbi:MAG: hypothetical protein L6R42_004484 [Xanthoria sp. 1 TBL-2021]|nr:MAG: hypothetical protein L6R42_004484 [Xanthoria sp. 1 TBL-2021]